ncbi:MAG: DUF2624 family protein [Bacilli bacterium]|nr:DUF2624 family protein [Bacilli bacterium]
MYDYLINEYINKLSLKEIKDFAFKQGIELTQSELDLIYDTIKNHWRTFVHGNPRSILEDIRTKVRPITYNKIENLYVDAKKRFL